MLAFGAAAHAGNGILSNPLLMFLLVILGIYVFLKFCGWAKHFSLSGGFKKAIYILTGLGLIVFNIAYSMGNQAAVHGDTSIAAYALIASLVWVLIFAFTLMAETK